MKIYEVTDPEFAAYGRILEGVDLTGMVEALKKTPCPNHKLNALEYHRSSELNLGADEFYLILGKQTDITPDGTFDTSTCKVFRAPAGVPVEVYATTLHYAPCNKKKEGFRVLVVLPKGTNTELSGRHSGGEDGHLTAVNKWLLGHPEGGLPEGSPMGLVGENLTVE